MTTVVLLNVLISLFSSAYEDVSVMKSLFNEFSFDSPLRRSWTTQRRNSWHSLRVRLLE